MEQSLVPEMRLLPGRSIPTGCPLPNSQPWKYPHTWDALYWLNMLFLEIDMHVWTHTHTIKINDEKRPWFWRRVEDYLWENYEGEKEERNVAYKLKSQK